MSELYYELFRTLLFFALPTSMERQCCSQMLSFKLWAVGRDILSTSSSSEPPMKKVGVRVIQSNCLGCLGLNVDWTLPVTILETMIHFRRRKQIKTLAGPRREGGKGTVSRMQADVEEGTSVAKQSYYFAGLTLRFKLALTFLLRSFNKPGLFIKICSVQVSQAIREKNNTWCPGSCLSISDLPFYLWQFHKAPPGCLLLLSTDQGHRTRSFPLTPFLVHRNPLASTWKHDPQLLNFIIIICSLLFQITKRVTGSATSSWDSGSVVMHMLIFGPRFTPLHFQLKVLSGRRLWKTTACWNHRELLLPVNKHCWVGPR